MHYAAMRGNAEAAQELLYCDDIDIEVIMLYIYSDMAWHYFHTPFQCKDEQQLSPLHLSCTYGQEAVTKLLLENGADIRSSGEKKQTSLHKACAVGNVNLVKMITFAAEQIYGREAKRELKEVAE